MGITLADFSRSGNIEVLIIWLAIIVKGWQSSCTRDLSIVVLSLPEAEELFERRLRMIFSMVILVTGWKLKVGGCACTKYCW